MFITQFRCASILKFHSLCAQLFYNILKKKRDFQTNVEDLELEQGNILHRGVNPRIFDVEIVTVNYL